LLSNMVDIDEPMIHLRMNLLDHAFGSLAFLGPSISTGSRSLSSVMGLLLDQYAITDWPPGTVPFV
jgi:hypothetical protein